MRRTYGCWYCDDMTRVLCWTAFGCMEMCEEDVLGNVMLSGGTWEERSIMSIICYSRSV